MRRTVLSRLTVLSLTALGAVVGACATAPAVDELDDVAQEEAPTEPEDTSSKLPPASQPTASDDEDDARDAGADAKKNSKDASPPAKDAAPTTKDAAPTTGDDCDPNNPLYAIELLAIDNPQPCPCSAAECCYLATACVPK